MPLLVSFPDQTWLDEVGSVPGVESVVWDPTTPPPGSAIEIFVAPYLDAARKVGAVAQVPSIRLVQLLSAGFDHIVEALPDGVAVANAGGVHDASTAELAVGLAVSSLRGIPEFVVAQRDARWRPLHGRRSLADRRVLVLGYGSVGRAIARRLVPFEVSLSAVASRARAGDDLVEWVHGIEELPDLLPEHDVVVVAVPLVESTRGLVGEHFLAALPDGALVVNVARGPVADTDAILRHAGRLLFGLDVTDPEPLPDGHPLFSAPEVLISPHAGGDSSAFQPRAVALLRTQLTRLVAGQEPLNIVHRG